MKNMIKFNTSSEDMKLIKQITDRIEDNNIDKMFVMMDLSAIDSNDCKIDFLKLLNFDDFDFYHDIIGIMTHIDRKTGKLTKNFVPRSKWKPL